MPGLRRDLTAAYIVAVAGSAIWSLFLPSYVQALNAIAMVFLLATLPMIFISLAAPAVWLFILGRGFTRHGRVMAWALPGLPLAFGGYILAGWLYHDYSCGMYAHC